MEIINIPPAQSSFYITPEIRMPSVLIITCYNIILEIIFHDFDEFYIFD